MALIKRIRHRLGVMRLSATSRAVLRDKLTYLSVAKLRRIEDAIADVERRNVAGDFIEFGVALGGSGILLARQAKGSRRYLGLDVFGMIPPPQSDKDDEKSKNRFDEIVTGSAVGIQGDRYYGYRDDLLGEVKRSFERHGVPVDQKRICLHQGLFEDSWPTLAVDRIALAHIDCDWYDPVRYCLDAIGDTLVPGGIVVIDDYHDYGGCRTAVDEFVRARGDFRFEDGRNPILRKE